MEDHSEQREGERVTPIRGAGLTHIGRTRESNQDRFIVDDELGLYVVCDGMGGHAAGEVAAEMAVANVREFVNNSKGTLAAVRDGKQGPSALVKIVEAAIHCACEQIHQAATTDHQYAGMGCTLTMFLLGPSQAVMGHVGDTRAYLLRDEPHQLSMDHTIAAEFLRAGAITEEQAKVHPYAHVLSRAVGSQSTVQVDTLVFELRPGDRLLLCSDGLSNTLDDVGLLIRHDVGGDLDKWCSGLVEHANSAGGEDNITVVLIEVGQAGEAAADQPPHPEEVEALKHGPLFSGLDLATLLRIRNVGELEHYARGHLVVEEGTECARLMVVITGRLAVSRPGGEAASVLPGEYIGEHTLLNPRPCRARVRALEPSSALVIKREELMKLVRRRPWLGVNVLARLGTRLSRELVASGHKNLDAPSAADLF